MTRSRWRGILAAGLALTALAFLVPWTSYTSFRHFGNRQSSQEVVRPLPFFMECGRKEIAWDLVLLQSVGTLLLAGAAALADSDKIKH